MKKNFMKKLLSAGLIAGTIVLFTTAAGTTVFAQEDYFWNAIEMVPSYGTGLSIIAVDGTIYHPEFSSYEDAMKNKVSVKVGDMFLHSLATAPDPYMDNGQPMVPLRPIADTFGFTLKWKNSEEGGIIRLTKGDVLVEISPGTGICKINGHTQQFTEGATIVKDGRTFLSADMLKDILSIDYQWDENSRVLMIN